MDPEQFDNLDDLLDAAEEEQKGLLELNKTLRKVISETISRQFPELITKNSENKDKRVRISVFKKRLTYKINGAFYIMRMKRLTIFNNLYNPHILNNALLFYRCKY